MGISLVLDVGNPRPDGTFHTVIANIVHEHTINFHDKRLLRVLF